MSILAIWTLPEVTASVTAAPSVTALRFDVSVATCRRREPVPAIAQPAAFFSPPKRTGAPVVVAGPVGWLPEAGWVLPLGWVLPAGLVEPLGTVCWLGGFLLQVGACFLAFVVHALASAR